MERNQFWIFLGLGLAVGACLEFMKSPNNQPVRLAGFTQFETLLEEGKAVHVEEVIKPAAKSRSTKDIEEIVPQKIAAIDLPPVLNGQPVEGTAAEKPAPPMTDEEKKKKEEEEKKKKELAKKKRLKEKKKKAREEIRKQREALEAEAKAKEEAEKEKKSDDGEAAVMQPGPALPMIGQITNDGLPKTVPEWEAYLMKDVDFERMAKFVKLYQTGTVKPEVFYPVIESMLQDSRPKIRSLAVVGLTSTPSTQSFTTLIGHRNDADSGIRKNIGSAISSYAQLENLKFLIPIITTPGDSAPIIEAIQILKRSATTNAQAFALRNQVPIQGSNQGGNQGRNSATALAKFYTPFLSALRIASNQSHDNGLRSLANQTAVELQTIILTLNPASAEIPPPTPVLPPAPPIS